MSITLGRNITSERVQRFLTRAESSLSSTYEKLSSGQRINRASDDAAGLSISTTLRNDARVFTQGMRNLNDGISAITIADSTLSELTGITTRILELAEQAANGSTGRVGRLSIDREAQSLAKEFSRLTASSGFNDLSLLDGTTQGMFLQAGYGTSGGINVQSGGARGTGQFNSQQFLSVASDSDAAFADVTGDGVRDLIAVDEIGGVTLLVGNSGGGFKAPVALSFAGGSFQSIAVSDINNDGISDIVVGDTGGARIALGRGGGEFTFSTGVTGSFYEIAVADVNGDGIDDIINSGNGSVSTYIGDGRGSFALATSVARPSGTDTVFTDFNGDGFLDVIAAGSATGAPTGYVYISDGKGGFRAPTTFSSSAGLSYTAIVSGDFNGDGIMDFAASHSTAVEVFLGNGSGAFSPTANSSLTSASTSYLEAADIDGDGNEDLIVGTAAGTLRIHSGVGNGTFSSSFTQLSTVAGSSRAIIGDFNSDGVADIGVASSTLELLTQHTKQGTQSLLTFDLTTQVGARDAMIDLRAKLDSLSVQRGVLGAYESRIQVAVSTLKQSTENYRAADSRIMDADVAAEAARLIRLGILQQTSAALLGQANQQPRIALGLLQNA